MQAPKAQKVVVIISITSDIGIALAKRYSGDGYTVVGTYRSKGQLNELAGVPDCHLFSCDISSKDSISEFVKGYKELDLAWDAFISCPCTPLPLEPFFESDFDEWNDSVHVNAIEQLRILHQLHPFRNKEQISNVALFAGGGINKSVVNFSAYTISKIMLIKMCEFLDSENQDLNIFIIGPGWTKTKTHNLVLEKADKAGEKYHLTQEFIKSEKGTSMDDIYGCIRWLSKQGKRAAGGRNFSVVYDKWKGEGSGDLARELAADIDMYKLRRFKNQWGVKQVEE